ncbi:MAG: hypothetical protein LUC94_07225, partial [Clostridiales bacterium]|nr:hypothetical protein [Clostridiales bacterium]
MHSSCFAVNNFMPVSAKHSNIAALAMLPPLQSQTIIITFRTGSAAHIPEFFVTTQEFFAEKPAFSRRRKSSSPPPL